MRSYADACGITRALDVVGERWAIPVVRELIFGPRRYSDLAAALPGVSTNILGSRLKELTAADVVVKRRLSPPAATTVYELTPWGAALEPVLISLGRWAARTPAAFEKQAFSASSFALSLRATFNPAAAAGTTLTLSLVMGTDVFEASIDDADFTIRRAEQTDAQVHLHGEPKQLADLVYQRRDPAEAHGTGAVQIEGPLESVQTFVGCFDLPEALITPHATQLTHQVDQDGWKQP